MPRLPDVARVSCEHADRCSGCPLIDRPYAEQLVFKRAKVARAASRYAALAGLPVAPTLAADPVVGYRTRAKLVVAPGGRVGLYEKGGHDVFDIPRCRVLARELLAVADALRSRVARDERERGPLAPWDGRGGGTLRAFDLREVERPEDGSKGVLVTFVVERSRSLRLEQLRDAARSLASEIRSVLGVAVNFHEGDDPQILGKESALLFGQETVTDRLGGSTHLATFGSFVQAHRGQAEQVHRLVAEAVVSSGATRPRVLDLYGGSGAIALGLASRGAEVVLVESFAPAAARAAEAAKRDRLPLSIVSGDVTIALGSLRRRGVTFDAAVMNPPRRGMSAAAREGVARIGAEILVYVSCDPGTLARDLDHFVRLGFQAKELAPIDMIPLTDQVETIAVLRRAPVPGPRRLYDDDEVIVAEKCPHEPTTPQGEYESSLLARIRSLEDAAHAVPIHRLDIGTSGAVFFARSPSFVEAWSRALHAPSARKVYVAAVRGVTPETGEITRDLHEGKKTQKATTRYLRLAVHAGHSLLEVTPAQGRTHQIRRHLAAIGHPVLGDARYGHAATNRFFEEKHGLDRTFLHCARIELNHPKSGKRVAIEAPLAGDLDAVIERLE